MLHRCFRSIKLMALLLCIVSVDAQLQAQRCGQERWSVKTGTDSGAGNIDLSNTQNSTIAQLVALTPPNPIPANSRFDPTENTVFVVNATLTDYKLEGGSRGDSDYHLVLQDDQGNTMVAEIPSPSCVGDSSPFAGQIATARAAFDAQFTATTSFQTANVPVQVTGVGFFDFPHGQHGAAPNVIELHPVLNIVFNPSSNAGDFSMSMAPPMINLVQGGSTSTTINTATSGTASAMPTLTVSGTPQGVSTQITTTGSDKATLSVMAAQSAPTGSFPLTITGKANGKSHTVLTQLNVSPFSSAPGTQQWEYKMISANTEQDVINQANALGSQDWELVSVVKVQGTTNTWRAFFKRLKNNF